MKKIKDLKNKKDWKGNGKTMVCLGVHNYSKHDREVQDYYATDPLAIVKLMEVEKLNNVWECACGEGHLAKVLEEKKLLGKATDLINRGYGNGEVDFLFWTEKWDGDIITNPPYRFAKEFIYKALSLIPNGKKVAMFLRVQFVESKGRYKLFNENPPKTIYVFSGKIGCAMNGNFRQHSQTAVPYAWYVWEKGFKGDTTIKWIFLDGNQKLNQRLLF